VSVPHTPGCQCHAVLCRTARGLIVDGVDLVPMPAPPPPATDPHDGWTPLVPGCAMPERPMPVLVSVEVEDDDEPWAYTSSGAYWSAADCEVFTTDRDEAFYSTERFRIKRDRDEPAKRLTAWRPAPAPYGGGAK